ncbi:hypothetical protein [Novosphingobium cyanobacteriorum]|uniref:Uncharacterized protein n=1 Tax=Novosphingobium cyanobacteriorum TaxID=3024215 RepID=A0ABT6CCH7_9SPHN|nr:hypothetical protein [Novosphingobium cyanobacteriorum]MDF8331645.1 hypothetical protein [Novosphingobium cyanobacteriorum]
MEADPLKPDLFQECTDRRAGEDLARQDMVSLKSSTVSCRTSRVDRPERKNGTAGPRHNWNFLTPVHEHKFKEQG